VGTGPAVHLVRGPRHATRVHSIDRAPFRALFHDSADDGAVLSFLRGFDVVIAWSSIPFLEAKTLKLGIPLLQGSPHPEPGVHASDHLYRALAPLGVLGPAPPPAIDLDEESGLAAHRFLGQYGLAGRDFIALHPSSGSPRKNWPLSRFRELALLLGGENWPFVWIEGEADKDAVASLGRIAEAPVARDLPLKTLGALLSLARGFVGNDSGVTHLAAAAGTPTIALFGPTDPAVWGPRGPRVAVVSHGATAEEAWEKARSLFDPP